MNPSTLERISDAVTDNANAKVERVGDADGSIFDRYVSRSTGETVAVIRISPNWQLTADIGGNGPFEMDPSAVVAMVVGALRKEEGKGE